VSESDGSGRSGWARALPRNVVALGLVSLLTDLSTEMMVWTIPFYLALLGGGMAWVGLVEGLRESLASVLKLASGWLSDRLGRRKPLVLFGYAASTVVKPLLALAAAPAHVLGLLAFERVGKGVRAAPRDALIAAAVPEDARGRAFSFHRALDHAGAVLGVAASAGLVAWLFALFRAKAEAGADLAPVDVFRTIYVISAVPAALAVLAILLFVRERAAATKHARLDLRAGYGRGFRVFLASLVVFGLGNSSDLFLLVRAGEVLGYDLAARGADHAALAARWEFPWQLPLMFLFLSFMKMASSLPGGMLADRIGRLRTLGLGWAVYAAVYVAFGFAATPLQVWLLLGAYGLFYGLTEGVEKAVVADLVHPDVQGAAYGLYAFADGCARFPASVILGVLYGRYGAQVAFGFGGGCAALALLVLLFAQAERR